MNQPEAPRVTMIRNALSTALTPKDLEIEDVSHEHAGHAGSKSGGGHFNVMVVSAAFAGLTPLKRHRLVYDALGDAMRQEIHALSIRAYTPDEL